MTAFDGFSEQAFTWNSVVLAISTGAAVEWFSAYPTVSGQSVFDGPLRPSIGPYAEVFEQMADWKVARPFGVHCDDAALWYPRGVDATAADPERSTAGRQLVSALRTSGIDYILGDERDAGLYVVHRVDNGAHHSFLKVFETPEGAFVEISAPVLVSALDLDDAGPDFYVSRFFAVPAVIQAAAVLAETPFPSVLMSFERSMAYPDVPASRRLLPFLDPIVNASLIIPLAQGSNVSLDYMSVEQTCRFGFSVPLTMGEKACISTARGGRCLLQNEHDAGGRLPSCGCNCTSPFPDGSRRGSGG